MKRLLNIIVLTLIFSGLSFAQSNFMPNYDIIDINPIDTNIHVPFLTNLQTNRIFSNSIFIPGTNIYNENFTHRHSLGFDFGTTIFATLSAPYLFNLTYEQPDGASRKALDGKFGFRFAYTLRLLEKMELDATMGMYFINTFYENSTSHYSGSVYAIPFSLGVRFYFNKHNRSTGFFLLPKLGGTFFKTKANLYRNDLNAIENKDTFVFDRYLALEMGFRIDISRGLGITSGIRPFIDISIMDIGVSYVYLLRFVPLPRFSIGILF